MSRPPASSPEALARMRRQKRKGTRPEQVVRSALTSLGHRYRLENSDLPGSPDMANRKRRWALFVHGCFWHHHEGCRRATIPKKNRDWWLAKFGANRRRDARKEARLRESGFRVVVIWECETTHEVDLGRILLDRLGRPSTHRLLPPSEA